MHRIILVGAGDMGHHHAPAWVEKGHEIAAIVDLDLARAQGLAKAVGGQVFNSYEQAIEMVARADVVDICVPLREHLPVTMAAAQHGKNILCEKPLARSLDEARMMDQAIRDNGVKFAAAFQRNLSPGVDVLRKWMADVIGTPAVFNSDLLQEVRPKRFMHDAQNNNGPIVDTCPHYFLLWETVFGVKPVSIYAQGGVMARGRPEIAHFADLAIDTASIVVTYEHGHVGAMTVSWGLPKGTPLVGRADRIVGPKGGAEGVNFHDFTWEGFELYRGSNREFVPLPPVKVFERQVELFVDYVEGKRERPGTDFYEARHLLHMSLAALESIKTGNPVRLEEMPVPHVGGSDAE